ncbi:DUF2603 domain-containing protein [Helicobacter felis]|uniref:UPF0763 protein Hfelis_08620 n=1 Tax=Helicobacter felis (strain ATCC 49179 / CCUG 28539 / NCTC 12436 / CS1) TaxID=936155 RepID=E7ABX7_HELFC|nr:DUF2603 domain-containing protein [Helicobacter felis]CBY82946.1 putative uncharacterized protein [Helicobacter felis ATCC 49179]
MAVRDFVLEWERKVTSMDNTSQAKLNTDGMQEIYQSLESGKNRARAKRIAPDQMLLELQEGALNTQEAWFVQDEQDHKFVVIPEVLLQYIVQVIQRAYEEKIMVELERDMATLTPIDFKDAMAVAFKKLEGMRASDGSLPRISSLDFVKQLKRQHPNLFFNLAELLESKKEEYPDLDDLENIPF